MNSAAAPSSLRARSRPVGAIVWFWTSTIAVNVSTVVVLAVLSHSTLEGGLAAVSAVLGLSLIAAIAPGALQLRAATDVAAGSPAPRPPWRIFGPLTLALVAAAPLIAWAVSIPAIAAVVLALQLPPAVALAVRRGKLIGSRRFGAVGASFMIDAGVRLVAGAGLGLLWGATGIAAGLTLATLAALAFAWDGDRLGARALGADVVASVLALGSVGLLANLDLLLAPRVLGSGADAFDVAALAAQAIFLALFAASWVAVPGAIERARSVLLALRPVALTLLLGLLAIAIVVALRPLIAAILDRPDPELAILVPLAVAKAMAGATAVAVNVAVARGLRAPWAAPLFASIALIAVAAALEPDGAALALIVLAAQGVALALAGAQMLSRPAGTARPLVRRDPIAGI